MKLKPVIVLATLMSIHISVIWAGIPEPDAILYGTVSIDGVPQRADDDVTVIARVEGVEDPTGSYHLGDDEIAGDRYVLRIRLESLTDGSGKIVFQGTDVSIDRSIEIYLKTLQTELPVTTFKITDRGTVGELDLAIMISPDSDGDMVIDQREIAWGLDPNNPDTDGDGVSDKDEVCYDGDCGGYDPYDPATGRGADLNANSVDTDGDGYTDYEEIIRGSSPIEAKDVPARITFYVDDDATGANDGTSWVDAYNCLQDALSSAFEGDEIWVARGIYTPDQGAGIVPGDWTATLRLINSVTIKGGFAGLGEPDPNARDIDRYETILSGDLNGDDIDVNDPCDLLTEPWRADNSLHVVTANGADELAVLDGFTITGGNANGPHPDDQGGGMYNKNGSPTLIHCTFIGNSAVTGGGMYNEDSSPTVTNCRFVRNWASWGAGIYSAGGSPTLTNCLFSRNSAGIYGGGMTAESQSSSTVRNCTFYGNCAYSGGGLCVSNSSADVVNCILWGNYASGDGHGPGITVQESGILSISYCDVEGGQAGIFSDGPLDWGTGNIEVDPCFASPGFWTDSGTPADANDDFWVNGDYHLKSEAGRWKPSVYSELDATGDGFIDLFDFAALANSWYEKGSLPADFDRSGIVDFNDLVILLDNYLNSHNLGEWVVDDVTSACIDAGDPNSDWTAELWPHGKCINMGAFGGTPQASMSLSDAGDIADLNNSDVADYTDLKLLAERWLSQEVLLPEDLDRNGVVNFIDFAIFADEWPWEE